MKMGTKAVLLILVLAVGLFAAGMAKRYSIGEIEANSAKYVGKKVTVVGTVETGYGVSLPSILIRNGSGGTYKIDDGTGEIWVVTQRGVPQKGAQLKVKGKVQNGVTIDGRNYGLVLYEDDRSFQKK
ncbi:MAG: hypothetical protein M3384_06105 [Acidobacteriota bacterium]|nr:hypothetical protein [Acidobacteriota bacterium]